LGYDDLQQIQNFKDLLLEEQRGFCCYCMRKIPAGGLRIEHVMPQNIKYDLANGRFKLPMQQKGKTCLQGHQSYDFFLVFD
jgi:hypothetical protein